MELNQKSSNFSDLTCLFNNGLSLEIFPSRLSLLQVIRNRYGDTIVKLVRKFEKVDFKHRKAALHLNFLQTCRSFNVIPKFLQSRVANKNLRRSQAH